MIQFVSYLNSNYLFRNIANKTITSCMTICTKLLVETITIKNGGYLTHKRKQAGTMEANGRPSVALYYGDFETKHCNQRKS